LTIVEETATSEAQTPPFTFLGKAYRTTNDLGTAFARNWEETVRLWKTEQPGLIRWLRHDLGAGDIAKHLEDLDRAASAGEDAQVFTVIRTLAPDSPVIFKERAVSAEALRTAGEAVA